MQNNHTPLPIYGTESSIYTKKQRESKPLKYISPVVSVASKKEYFFLCYNLCFMQLI